MPIAAYTMGSFSTFVYTCPQPGMMAERSAAFLEQCLGCNAYQLNTVFPALPPAQGAGLSAIRLSCRCVNASISNKATEMVRKVFVMHIRIQWLLHQSGQSIFIQVLQRIILNRNAAMSFLL